MGFFGQMKKAGSQSDFLPFRALPPKEQLYLTAYATEPSYFFFVFLTAFLAAAEACGEPAFALSQRLR